MKIEEVKVCIVRTAGTNCDAETQRSFEVLGVNAETLHINKLVKEGNLPDYQILVFPGGFSYGDYIRSGAILGKELESKLANEIKQFVEEERAVIGICNGFQILVEAGLLPGFNGISEYPEVALANNSSAKFECRWIYMKNENAGKCIFTKKLAKNQMVRMPIAHGEGRFLMKEEYLKRLEENDQIVLKYCKPDGQLANGEYPFNPNGSMNDIAGICNPIGNVFALMPHPERAFSKIQYPDWTSETTEEFGDGKAIFESVIDYVCKKF